MTCTRLLLGVLCALGISAGQVLFKMAATTLGPLHGPGSGFRYLTNPYLVTSFIVYFGTTVLWIWLLRVTPLKQAYPVMALAFLIVPLLSRLFLQERLEAQSLIGGVVIAIGIYIATK